MTNSNDLNPKAASVAWHEAGLAADLTATGTGGLELSAALCLQPPTSHLDVACKEVTQRVR